MQLFRNVYYYYLDINLCVSGEKKKQVNNIMKKKKKPMIIIYNPGHNIVNACLLNGIENI